MKKKVSIIIPVYKVEKYLEECIESILGQTYTNIEVILVNDGSPDNCAEICDRYAKKDKRIKVIHKKNEGVSAARNDGLDIATGEYITFVDSDDFVSQNFVKEMVEAMTQNKVELVTCEYNYITKNEEVFVENTLDGIQDKKTIIDNIFYNKNSIEGYCWNKLFVRSLIGNLKFDVSIKVCEDLLFVFQYLQKIEKIYSINKPLYNYRLRKTSVLNNGKKDLTIFNALNKLYDSCKDNKSYKNLYCISYYKTKKSLKSSKIELKFKYHILQVLFSKEYIYKTKLFCLYYLLFPKFIKTYIRKMKQEKRNFFE